MRTVLLLVGLGQIALALASLSLPRMLGWREQIARLEPFTGRVFWVYATYILGTNLCLGCLTALAPDLLLDRSPLARTVAGYATVYWGARFVIQFWFRGVTPKGRWYALADLAVTLAIAFWAASYGAILFDLW